MNKETLIQKIKESKNSRIKIAVTDIDGVLRGKYISKEKFLSSINKHIGLCDVIFGWDSADKCYENVELTGWHTGYPDAKAMLDINTFREVPWDNSTPFFLCDFSDDLKYASSSCSRSLLKRVVKECNSLGFKPLFAQEFEWFNFKGTPTELYESNFENLQPISPGMFGYSILRSSLNQTYFNELFEFSHQFNIPLEGLHTETGPGVLEAAIAYDDILAAADKATLFKSAVKEIAYRNEFMATFMAKWNKNLPGCGGHIHQSLWDIKGKKNLFYNDNQKNEANETMKSYIAGQLICLPEILPMYAPNVNSYKRLNSGDWAPSTLTWGIDNRTTAIRVIHGGNKSARIEMRVPGADVNPYLAMAASLASGLYGIKNKLKLEVEETHGNGYKNKKNGVLPASLSEATKNMASSKIAKDLFGESFVNHFIQTREWELKQGIGKDENWELQRYFEII